MSRKPSARRERHKGPSRPLVAFGALVGHLPSAILSLPAFVSRSPPDNSCMYPNWISRRSCSAGIVRCITPLAQSRKEANSSSVNGADKSGFIFQNMRLRHCRSSQSSCHNQTELPGFPSGCLTSTNVERGCFPTKTLVWPRRLHRMRDRCAVLRTLLQCVCTQRRNCIGQLSPFSEYAPTALRNKWNPPPQSN
jgi:hypothetical protein